MSDYYSHRVRIYYEDTDLSGVVYHANYLKYFERAREHIIGPEELARRWDEEGVGFVVYKAELTYKAGARLGEEIEIRTYVRLDGLYRSIFQHEVWRADGSERMVFGEVHMVCVDKENNKKLVPLPHWEGKPV
jgi:tol-pal system-associated acyl-CoA thioesterase